jgi:putative hemolysin
MNNIPKRLHARWATSEADVHAAQRLRYQVFVEELGARPYSLDGITNHLEADEFDPFCDHLLVHAVNDEDELGEVIGTYRVLGPQGARRAGGLYADTEFDLSPLAPLRSHTLELGRSCVHPAWRTGGVILALWTALFRYMQVRRLETMIGCASIGLGDGGATARHVWRQLSVRQMAAPNWHVIPRNPLSLTQSLNNDQSETYLPSSTPALFKGYLRCGARVLGPPAFDSAFNTADLLMMLQFSQLAPQYRKHLLGNPETVAC